MNLFRAFATISGLTMVSRVLGLVREMMIAAFLGSGPVAEAFFVAFRLPNLFRRFFAEGAFNMAFVPLFAKRLEGEGEAAAKSFAEEALAGLFSVVLALTLLAQLFMPWVIYAIAAGFAADPEKLSMATLFATIQFPYLIFMSLVALFAGVLNSLDRFAAAAAAPTLLNVAMIVAIGSAWALEADIGLWLSWSVFVAGLLQLALVVVAARRAGFSLRLRPPRWTSDMARLVRLGAPGLLVGGVTQINILIGTLISSFFAGAVVWTTLADRVYNLPLGVVGIALGVALLPELSRRIRVADAEGALTTLRRAVVLSLAFSLPAAAALIVIPDHIMRLIFERNAFSAEDVIQSADALALFAAGLPAYILIKALSPVFFANEDTVAPLRYAVVSTGFATALSIGLAPFIEWRGVPIGTAAGAWLNVALLVRGLALRGVIAFDGWVFGRALRLAVATAVMVGALLVLELAAGDFLLDPWGRIPGVLGLVALGGGVYAASCLTVGAVRRSDLSALRRRPT